MTIRARALLVCVVCLAVLRGGVGVSARAGAGPALTVTVATNPASLSAGVPATVIATALGSIEPVEFAFWLYDGNSWTCVQQYGSTATYSWTPQRAGTHALQVWVRRAGTDAVYEAWAGTGYLTVAPAPPAVPLQVTLSSDTAFPAPTGSPITWTAAARGGGETLEFAFWRFDASGWKAVQPYGPSPRYSWTPGGTDAGIHALQVWVRAAGSTAPYDEYRGTGYFEIQRATSVAAVSIESDRAVPLLAASPVTWTASAGGRRDVEFQFWRFSRSAWSMVQDYGATRTYTWTPEWADVGAAAIQVWARRTGSSEWAEAWAGTGLFDVLGPSGQQCSALPAPAGECYKPVPSYVSRDYRADLVLRAAGDVATRRRALVRWIWGQDSLPDHAEIADGSLEQEIDHPDIASLELTNLARVNRYRIDIDIPAAAAETPSPIHSFVYEFVPAVRNDRLLVYNQGHIRDPRLVFRPETALGADTVLRVFLEQGYTVLVLQMPLLGDNADPRFPTGEAPDLHDLLGERARGDFNPLKAFLHPIRIALNYARSRRSYSHVSMMGVSGGGWATTVYAALDPGVRASFPVAGSMPVALNQGLDDPCRHGIDWEQQQFPAPADDGPSAQPLGYLDLYVMGSTAGPDGAARQQIQILNRYDPCCFKGAKAENTYAEELGEFVSTLGGSYRLAIDSSHFGHLISECALRSVVLPALGR